MYGISFTYIFTDIFYFTVAPSITIDMIVEDLLYIRAGDPVRIPATIKGRPVPKVTWDFYGKAKTQVKNKLHTLPVDSEVRSSQNNDIVFLLNLLLTAPFHFRNMF